MPAAKRARLSSIKSRGRDAGFGCRNRILAGRNVVSGLQIGRRPEQAHDFVDLGPGPVPGEASAHAGIVPEIRNRTNILYLFLLLRYHASVNEERYLPVPREDLEFDVEMALRKGRRLWPRRFVPGDHDRFRPLATEIVAHLELCRLRFFRRPPDPWHRTPDPLAGSRTEEPEAGPGREDRSDEGAS